jgi:hypothetical protein
MRYSELASLMVSVFKIGEKYSDVHSLICITLLDMEFPLVYITVTVCGPVLGAYNFLRCLPGFLMSTLSPTLYSWFILEAFSLLLLRAIFWGVVAQLPPVYHKCHGQYCVSSKLQLSWCFFYSGMKFTTYCIRIRG